MKNKPKGRKIYKLKDSKGNMFHKPSKLKTVLTTLLTVLVAGLLVLVGYSVAAPIWAHFQGGSDDSAVESLATIAPDLTGTTAPTTTTATTTTTTTTHPVANIAVNGKEYVGQFLSAEAMQSLTTLNQALGNIAENATVVVPLKVEGGSLLYASELESVQSCGANGSDVTLRQMTDCIAEHGLTAIAQISVLNDNLYPNVNYDAGYVFEEDHSRWLDNTTENDGKPWLSPFSEDARAYLQDITRELAGAGFNFVLCQDLTFPNFYDTDLDYIGKCVKDKQMRYLALTGTLNAINTAALEHGATAMFEFSLYDALNRDVEALQPVFLELPNAVVDLDMNYFRDTFWYGNEKFSMAGLTVSQKLDILMPIADALTGEMAVVPCIKASSLSDTELNEAITWLGAHEYKRYLIK